MLRAKNTESEKRKARVSGAINLLFYLVTEKVNTDILLEAYNHVVEIEPDEGIRIEQIILEATNNSKEDYLYIMDKISAIEIKSAVNKSK